MSRLDCRMVKFEVFHPEAVDTVLAVVVADQRQYYAELLPEGDNGRTVSVGTFDSLADAVVAIEDAMSERAA